MREIRHLIEPTDFTVSELENLFTLTQKIIQNPKAYMKTCKGKILVTLFYEPSTRTRFSFEAAMLKLGGNVLGFSDPSSSSVSKGESVADTIRIVSGYADIAVMRHIYEGAPKAASLYAGIPVINAGDGGHQHPTQTLTDLFTIQKTKGSFDNLTIGICGDLKHGRTTHSLVKAMARYENIHFVLMSPKELSMPSDILREMDELTHISYEEVPTIEEGIENLDILYMTRVQRERFLDLEEYERVKDSCILDEEKLKLAKADMIILHPLPRVNEITPEIDNDPRAYYFKQAEYGMYVRMALMLTLLKDEEARVEQGVIHVNKPLISIVDSRKCNNSKCITNMENGLKNRFVQTAENLYRCDYCSEVYRS